MFNDSHETTRNVGMMGVVLAVLVLIGLYGLGAAFLTGMGMLEGEGRSLQVSIDRLETQIEESNEALGEEALIREKLEHYAAILTEIEESVETLEEREKEVDLAEVAVAAAKAELETRKRAFGKYREQYRDAVRALAKGEIMDLSELRGDGFEKVRVLGVSPLYLKVMSSSGPVGIPYQELPDDLQDRFQFGEEEAAAYREWLQVQSERREQQMADFREKQKAREATKAVEAKEQEIETLALQIKKLENQILLLEQKKAKWVAEATRYEREARQARAEGRVTSKFGLATQASRKAARVDRQIESARRQILTKGKRRAQLQSEMDR